MDGLFRRVEGISRSAKKTLNPAVRARAFCSVSSLLLAEFMLARRVAGAAPRANELSLPLRGFKFTLKLKSFPFNSFLTFLSMSSSLAAIFSRYLAPMM